MAAEARIRVAIVGATGAVGQQMLAILEERAFPVGDLVPFASTRSEGREVHLGRRAFKCQVLKPGCFAGIDMAFFDASDAVSRDWVPEAARAGAWVVDNSATSRMDPTTPLVVPEVNGELLDGLQGRVVAGPNCSTAQLVLPLKALSDRWGLKRVVVSSYQSVSGAGSAAIEELRAETRAALEGEDPLALEKRVFAHPIAFNCIPQIGSPRDDGYTGEEHKIIAESRKILDLPSLRITATAVRVPTVASHGESVAVELSRPFELAQVRGALAQMPGVVVQDDLAQGVFPMSCGRPGLEGASGRDAVYVGRLRRDESVENGLHLWIVSDNLRKGAALNAIQIGERLLKRGRA